MSELQNNFPDYSKYSLSELFDVLNRVEKEKYPENIRLIEEQIKIKELFEVKNNYKLFNKDNVVYKSKLFVWTLITLLFLSLLDNLVSLLSSGRLISLFYLIIAITVLVFVLSNNQKQKNIIKIYSFIIMIPGSLKLLALLLLTIKYLASPSEENWIGISLNGAFNNSMFFIMLIYFALGLYYLLTINKNIIIRYNSTENNRT
jgi:hypothetical protein